MANNDKGIQTLSDRLKHSNFSDNKPDFRELDLGSPVSPLRTRTRSTGPSQYHISLTTTTTSSSSSSSGSFSGRVNPNPGTKRHSGELTLSGLNNETCLSPKTRPGRSKPGHGRSDSSGSSGSHSIVNETVGGTVNSPPLNVLPTGNIICPSGRTKVTGQHHHHQAARKADVLGSGTVNYGHGSIMRAGGTLKSSTSTIIGDVSSGGVVSERVMGNIRGNVIVGGGGGVVGDRVRGNVVVGGGGGSLMKKGTGNVDPEELKKVGNEHYKRGHFGEALLFYDRAIAISPSNAALRSNRAAALTGLGRVGEAVREGEEAVRLDPAYGRAHHRLGSLLIRLGQVEVARRHLCYAGQQPDPTELHKLQVVEKHLNKCFESRRNGDWKSTLREGDAAITAGADYSPQLFLCRAESLLKLLQIDDVESILSNTPKIDPSPHCCSNSKFFGMLSEAYLFYVQAQIEMALGRFENAVTLAEKARKIDPRGVEIAKLLNTVRLVAKARARGNDLFNSERFTEACAAYGEGLKLDPSNSVLYGNRAACWYKLGMWEKSIEDCNHALRIHPNYTKALLRRAASNNKLERWGEAVRDYEVVRKQLPQDNEVAESLFHAQVALKKSRGEEVYNMRFGGDVEEITGLEHFRATISSPGVSVVHFESPSNPQCQRISSLLDTLCSQYPFINFLKVDIEVSRDVAEAESLRIVPTFKIYKNGSRVKEIVNPTNDVLQATVRHYSF
ncbi:TPR repeat-containing thioredoxin TTL1-like isoform X2 [Silene latifolia]|uniref:TPR repeat-containing thioredoxin TTL1-like isoform X2 n=1 Tax=Silene latifolia TaxID=37657 RepID=UPI003D7854E0